MPSMGLPNFTNKQYRRFSSRQVWAIIETRSFKTLNSKMTIQTPPPPSITPRQMTLLRVVTSMAWSDGHLAAEEVDLMLARFSQLFAKDATQQKALSKELREYLVQNIPLDELIPKLGNVEERELVLWLGYEVIQSSARTPDEPKINMEEAAAYQRLVQLLDLPDETVKRVEAEFAAAPEMGEGVVETLARKLEEFIRN